MKEQYVVKKSLAAAVTPMCLLFFWLIIPLFIMIARMIKNACYSATFYEDKVVIKSGVLNKQEKISVFAGVLSVSINQSLLGRIFGYGDVNVDVKGKWDVSTQAIKKPKEFKAYLESRVVDARSISMIAHS